MVNITKVKILSGTRFRHLTEPSMLDGFRNHKVNTYRKDKLIKRSRELYHINATWFVAIIIFLSHTFRFIDDLLTINDNNLFLQNLKDIYPPGLQLNLESSGDHVTFLDLDLTLVYGHLDVKLFDKRDSFPFAIVHLPFLSSNIPTTTVLFFHWGWYFKDW